MSHSFLEIECPEDGLACNSRVGTCDECLRGAPRTCERADRDSRAARGSRYCHHCRNWLALLTPERRELSDRADEHFAWIRKGVKENPPN